MTDGGAASAVVQQLEQAVRARRQASGLRERLDAARLHAQEAEGRVRAARSRLSDETEDVRRLESLSWTQILAALRGDRATALERETAERDAAHYAVADAEARHQIAAREVAGLQAQLDDLGDVAARYAAALAAKQEWATSHDPEAARRLADLAERRGRLLAEDAEAREAQTAGCEARDQLTRAHELLRSARSWASWDTFGGGGMFSDMMKYDKLDQVAAVLRKADLALGRFSRELADLHLSGVPGVQVDGLTRAFDVFFDNLFSDLAVRSRIQEAAARVEQARATVQQTLAGLEERGRRHAGDLAALDDQREELLLR